jgi:hypothetical protein
MTTDPLINPLVYHAALQNAQKAACNCAAFAQPIYFEQGTTGIHA